MSQELARSFGRFTLLARLGRGGMAEVFLARAVGAHGFERQLVIKRMHAHLTPDPRFTRMFIREARLSARLVHANIVPVFDFGEEEGHLYLAMEYVDGVDLRYILKGLRKRNDPVPVEIACFVTTEILRGLDYAHRLPDAEGNPVGVVHRDISPSNILVSREGEVKVCDFGIAVATTDHMTAAGTLKGKFAYMSPEQARGLPVDRRSDVFGAGLVLWEMLAARRLYQAPDDVQTLIAAQQARHPPPPTDRAPHGKALAAILQGALAPDPKDRYHTAAEFADALGGYLAQTGLFASSTSLARFLQQRCATEMRRRPPTLESGAARDAEPSSESVPSTFTSMPHGPRGAAGEPLPPEVEGVRSPLAPDGPAPQQEAERPLWPEPPPPPPPTPVSRPPEKGIPTPVALDPGRALRVPLLAWLVERGLLRTGQAEVVVGHTDRWACSTISAILAHRFLTESELCHALAELHGLPTVDLAEVDIPPRVFRKLPRQATERFDVIPFALETVGGRVYLSVACSDPEALTRAQSDLEFAAGANLRPFVARFSAVAGMIRRLWGGEEAPIPALAQRGAPEAAERDGEMIIERLDGEALVDTAVEGTLELDDSVPRRFKR